MKKKIFGLCAAVCLLLTLVCPPLTAAGETAFDASQVPYSTMVSDGAELLTAAQAQELDARAWELTQKYRCAVYIVTLTSLGSMDPASANQYILDEYGLGYGSDQSCVVLLISTEYRDYDIMAHGYGNIAFTDYGKDKMVERFIGDFGEGDWYEGFTEYLDCCEEYLHMAREGEPFDVDSDRSPLVGIALGVLAPLLIAFIICSVFKAQMKTAKIQKVAQDYIDQQGLVLTAQNDQFLHTTRTERYIEPPKSSGGTSVDSSGSSHKSGKY